MTNQEYLEWLALERDAELKLAMGTHPRIKAPLAEGGKHLADAIELNAEMRKHGGSPQK